MSNARAQRQEAFSLHSDMVKSVFGPGPVRPVFGRISESLNTDLVEFITKKLESNDRDVIASPDQAARRIDDSLNYSSLLLTSTENVKFDQFFEQIPAQIELNPFDSIVAALHSELRKIFAIAVGSPFAFVNSRAFISIPATDGTGPFNEHTDQFDDGHLKVMIYPSGMSAGHGGIRFTDFVIDDDQPPGTAVLFDNSQWRHQGMGSVEGPRLAIEVTIFRALLNAQQSNRSHFFGRHLRQPADLYRTVNGKTVYSEIELEASRPDAINVGSGLRDWGPKWLLLDALNHPSVSQIDINPECLFPAVTSQSSLVYSSHHIEHLPDSAVERVLSEAYRCLRAGGKLLLKIPDFDLFVSAYIAQDFSLQHQIGVGKVLWSWANKGIETTPENIFSMMFCGYWTKDYGDHFSREVNRDSPLAYHGPANVAPENLNELMATKDPHLISQELCKVAAMDPHFSAFNHQNAWSKVQLIALAERQGFRVVEDSKSAILQLFSEQIPDLREMQNFSLYLVFEPM